MKNLVAYIPTLNQQHIDWFKKHEGIDTNLFLISQAEAEILIPRLVRNVVAVPTEIMVSMLRSYFNNIGRITAFSESWIGTYPDFEIGSFRSWVAPDEDVSHAFAEKYLLPERCHVQFESIRARYDMRAVFAEQPVADAIPVITDNFNAAFMDKAAEEAEKSPDWWRQVGAAAFTEDGDLIVSIFNVHMPTEYEVSIFGDPALNRDAGQTGKSCSLHAEQALVSYCALMGESLKGAKVYVTTFPCEVCARILAAAGISKLYFRDGYSSLNAQEVLRTEKVEIYRVEG